MRSLSAQQILRIWEVGQGQSPVERALTLLTFVWPDKTRDELASLTVGQRDAYLLKLRELTLGSLLNGVIDCPKCRERLEFQLNAPDFFLIDPTHSQATNQVLQVEAFEVGFRLPNSWDLAAISTCSDTATADALLLQRCISQVRRNGLDITPQELPAELITQLSNQMVEADPQAEILLSLNCTACGYEWKALFDILSFFWTELVAQAKRLLQEVHTLARFYGWRESDILAMSARRRQSYLEMVTGN
jgi:hypothetical protein